MRWIALVFLVAIAACMPTKEAAMMPDNADSQTCGAADLQRLVGQPEEMLHKIHLKPPLRILKPNMAVTMDFRSDRLNIGLDSDGRIARAFCG